MNTLKRIVIWVAGFVVLIIVHVSIDGVAWKFEPESDPVIRGTGIPPGVAILLSAGNRPLLADYLWIDAVQYIGGTLAHHKHEHVDGQIVEVGMHGEDVKIASRILYELTNNIAYVDPQFIFPYYLVSLFLADPHGYPDLAVELLETGVHYNPQNWVLRFWFGFQTLFIHQDRQKAIEEISIARNMPDAPAFVSGVYDVLATASGSDIARLMLVNALKEAESEFERDRLQTMIKDLETHRDQEVAIDSILQLVDPA